MSDIKTTKEQAYMIAGQMLETADLMARCIEEGDWQTFSDLTASTSHTLADISRASMLLAVKHQREEL